MRGNMLIRTIAIAAATTALTGAGFAGAQAEPPPERNAPPGSNDIPSAPCEFAAEGNPLANLVTGTPGDDVLTGGPGVDIIDGRGGDDILRGFGDNDVLCGGPGADLLSPGAGDDSVRAGAGNDRIWRRAPATTRSSATPAMT